MPLQRYLIPKGHDGGRQPKVQRGSRDIDV